MCYGVFFTTGGKSAIMAAIIVGLGGKATTTNRNTALQQFIRTGSRYAVCIVQQFIGRIGSFSWSVTL